MDAEELRSLKTRIAVLVPVTFLCLGLVFFLPAGTFDYWEAWVYCAVLFTTFCFVLVSLFRKSPELLVRRTRLSEKEPAQKRLVFLVIPVFLAGFLIPGLDHRFGWLQVPVPLVLAADCFVVAGYLFVYRVFQKNPYASRVVEVVPGQNVISTGPYAIVRHPMYLGVSVMWLATPVALGSYAALTVFLILPVVLIIRDRNEEEVLLRDLPGYREYMQKVRYRLITGIW